MSALQLISKEVIESHFNALAKIGNLGPQLEDGFLRASWSNEETQAMEYVRTYAESKGLESRYDEIGNLFISTPSNSKDAKVIQIGSHLDTVPRGGLFDGGVGIVAGLEIILAHHGSCSEVSKRLELVIWRGEESGTFGQVYKGSKAAFGLLDPSVLDATFNGVTMREAILSQGYDVKKIEDKSATINQDYIDSIEAHFEIHIEQATKLEQDACDIGIVTSIRGPKRYRILVKGEAAHSGGTPMGVPYRKDANLAMAHMQVALDALGKNAIQSGDDLVQTVGVINSDQDFNKSHPLMNEAAITKVANLAYFTLDIRSNDNAFLDAYTEEALTLLSEVAKDFNVEIEVQAISASKAVETLDPKLQEYLESSASELSYSNQRLPSGAGHDVCIVAQQKKSDGSGIPSALVFIPCRNGVSHNPLEFTTYEAIEKGANVVAGAVSKLISE